MNARRIALLLSILIFLFLLATGWTNVAPGEIAVVRRLGRVVRPAWGPGPHLAWPAGIDRIDRIRTDEVRRIEIGNIQATDTLSAPGTGEFLTGDRNLLRAVAAIQYRVADPGAFSFRTSDREALLKRLAESSLTRALAASTIDASLGEGRTSIALAASRDLDTIARRYDLGISILGVSLTDTRPPPEVAPDFAAAEAARSHHDRRLNEAKTYEATTLTKADSLARARIERAHAGADRVVALARSKANRFVTLLAEAGRSRQMTLRRIYLDAVKELLPKVRRKLFLTPEEPVDLSILGDR